MKKLISVILSLICVFMLVACEGEPVKNPDVPGTSQQNDISDNSCQLEATVLEIYDGSILVEPAEGTNESKSSDKIVVSTQSADKFIEFQVGESVLITYDGAIMETYPAQLGQVYNIKKVS